MQGQGEVHHVGVDRLRHGFVVSLRKALPGNQSVRQAERERHGLAPAGSADRRVRAVNGNVNRPIHQEIQSPYPSVSAFHASPNLGRPQAESGQNVAYVTGSTLIVRNFPHARHGETVPVCHNLFSDCSGPASSLTAPIGLPVIPPQDPTGTAVTAASDAVPQPSARGGDLLRPS